MPISQERLHSIILLARDYRNIIDGTLRGTRQNLEAVRSGRITTAEFVRAMLNLITITQTEVNDREPALLAEEIQYRTTASRNKSERERRERQRRAQGVPIRKQAPEMAWARTDPRFGTPQSGHRMVPRKNHPEMNGPENQPPHYGSVPAQEEEVIFDKSNLEAADLAEQFGLAIEEARQSGPGPTPPAEKTYNEMTEDERAEWLAKWEQEEARSRGIRTPEEIEDEIRAAGYGGSIGRGAG